LDANLTKSIAFHPQNDGQIEVIKRMIVHILHMYNSKHPCIWDESLSYVFFQKSNAKYKQHHHQHRVLHKFQVGDKVWLHLQKAHITGPNKNLHPIFYGPYIITKDVGDNAFEINIPPFLGWHPLFNVDLLRPYFPPLLDTSDIA
jgi:ribosomal protein L21E